MRRSGKPAPRGTTPRSSTLARVVAAVTLCAPLVARAEPVIDGGAGGVLLIGPHAALYVDDAHRDLALGGGAVLAWRRDAPLSLLGGGLDVSLRSEGGVRLAADLIAAVRFLAGTELAVGVGPTFDLREGEAVRRGGHATAWIVVGAAPFVRAVAEERTGFTLEIGLAVPLPTLRW